MGISISKQYIMPNHEQAAKLECRVMQIEKALLNDRLRVFKVS